ncbi:MAG: DUF5947 family protein [Terriglobales bacterium]
MSNLSSPPPPVEAFRVLARLRGQIGARCDLCSAPLAEPHGHLLGPGQKVACACPACGLLLGSGAARYRRLPTRVLRLGPDAIAAEDWRALAIPIGLAFLFQRDSGAGAALYPSPAGTLEAELDDEIWARLGAGCPPLGRMAPEVEGVLALRLEPGPARPNPAPPRHYLAPRDRCLALTAILGRHWRGFGGGETAWQAVAAFFDALDREALAVPAGVAAAPPGRAIWEATHA